MAVYYRLMALTVTSRVTSIGRSSLSGVFSPIVGSSLGDASSVAVSSTGPGRLRGGVFAAPARARPWRARCPHRGFSWESPPFMVHGLAGTTDLLGGGRAAACGAAKSRAKSRDRVRILEEVETVLGEAISARYEAIGRLAAQRKVSRLDVGSCA